MARTQVKSKGRSSDRLVLTPTTIKSRQDITAFKVALSSQLAPRETVTVVASLVLTHAVEAYPKEITQAEQQLVQFSSNAYFFTPYRCQTQNSNFKLSSSSIETYSRVSPTSVDGNTVSYGPYTDSAPYSFARAVLHYENNGPFLEVVSLQRLIQVSHWGTIQVEEHLNIQHTGQWV